MSVSERMYEERYISRKDICEGQTTIKLACYDGRTGTIILPKSLLYFQTDVRPANIVHGSVKWFSSILILPKIHVPIGLLWFNGIDTPYALARPHISQAMLALHKICTVNGYGKGVATVIMRAMYETGAIMADEWNLIDSKKKLKHV